MQVKLQKKTIPDATVYMQPKATVYMPTTNTKTHVAYENKKKQKDRYQRTKVNPCPEKKSSKANV